MTPLIEPIVFPCGVILVRVAKRLSFTSCLLMLNLLYVVYRRIGAVFFVQCGEAFFLSQIAMNPLR